MHSEEARVPSSADLSSALSLFAIEFLGVMAFIPVPVSQVVTVHKFLFSCFVPFAGVFLFRFHTFCVCRVLNFACRSAFEAAACRLNISYFAISDFEDTELLEFLPKCPSCRLDVGIGGASLAMLLLGDIQRQSYTLYHF